jgi:hypothetical protein
MIKSLCVAATLVLAMALFGVAPASATTFHIKSCLKEGKECKTSSVGTTIEAKSEITFKEKEEKTENKCTLTLSAKVADATTEKAGDDMTLSITKAAFTECSGTEVEATGLPWTAEADATEFEEKGALELFTYKFTTLFLGCKYEVIGFDDVLSYFVNAPSYWLTLVVGSVKETTNGFFCWPLLKVRNDSVTPLLIDPNYTSANTMVVG